jgi:acylaminoacyl-peptidase
MTYKINIELILLFIFIYASNLVKSEMHPFSPLDLVKVKRINAHSISPNSQYMVFDANKYTPENNRKEQNLFITNLKTKSTVQLTSDHADISPFWLNDNTIAFISNRSGKLQLWYTPLDFENLGLLKNETMVQLTKCTTSINNVVYNKNANRLIFSAQAFLNGTMVNDDLYVEHEDNKYTSGMVYDNLFIRHWDTFLKPKVREQLFVVDLNNENGRFSLKNEPVNIMKGNKMECPIAPFGDAGDFSISSDGQTIAFSSRVEEHSQAWNTNTNVYLVNYPIGGEPSKIENLTESNPGYDTSPRISPDGQWIAYLEMREKAYEADKNRIMLYNIETKTYTELVPKWDRSAASITWSLDSTMLYVTAPSLGRVKIYAVQLNEIIEILKKKKKDDDKVPEIPSLVVKELVGTGNNGNIQIIPKGQFKDNTEEILVFTRSTMMKPKEIYCLKVTPWDQLQIENENKEILVEPPKSEAGLTQVSNMNSEFDEEIQVSKPEEFYFKGHNKDLVHGWFLKPVNFDETKKYPLAFLIHGGPQGAWDDSFGLRWNVQSYAGAGYVVAAINFHGSLGYGEQFQRAVSKSWGNDSYNDLMKGLDYILETYSFIDESKVCGLGASYGGFMVNWINGHTDRFACLVNHDGIFDTINAYYTTEELFFTEYEFGGVPWDKKAKKLYDQWNPREFVENWKTPTLVIHGGKDYRLTESEGIATFTALQRLGVKSRFLYFPDENHWVLKQANLLFWYQQIFKWLELFTDDKLIENEKKNELDSDKIKDDIYQIF